LLVDDSHLARLHAEIGRRPRRTWEDYAAELWTALVASELQSLEAERVGVSA
jgi:hypothetical protein